jgi:hypothetical protein
LKLRIKKYSVKVISKGMTSPLNFVKIHSIIKNVLGGHRQTQRDRQNGDIISLVLAFKESRPKNSDVTVELFNKIIHNHIIILHKRRNAPYRSLCISGTTVVRLRAKTGVQFPEEQGFCLHRKVQTAAGNHSTSYPIGTSVIFLGITTTRE